ncbi:HDOD domain-containing protein [Colwellia demingiae]|uniref:HDOD domain-containing protein n=1 Tax=Colwellia demingiae TaxID=89401 RepID=A0A5C6QLX5_9GAMM|nr:HDOD domain-containing protein [Colwellia demingiae]TWX69640.1 HDOD domain-containing protein [Colwellia demingiae]
MKNTYIARQAILNEKLETIGYELLFRDSLDNKFPDIEQDVASSKLIIQNHIHGDIQKITMGKLAFINFTENSLIHKFPLMFDKDTIVIELVGHEKPTKKLLKIIKFYYNKGYKIALTEYDLAPHWDVLFPYIDIVKVDIGKINTKRLFPAVTRMKLFNVAIAAEKVETKNQKQTLVEVGFNYFQGYFYHQPEIIAGQALAPIKTQMLQLLSETFNYPLNYETVAEIISHDVNLTVGLLKMVNNVATGTRVEITSLKQAAAYLGEDKLRQFVSVLALSNLTSETTDEVCKQALITGKMMFALSDKGVFKSVSDFAFITGLLSAIEVMLSMPMAEIVKTMPLAQPIESALVKHAGLLGQLLDLTTSYILGHEDLTTNGNLNETLHQYSLDQKMVQEEFLKASEWCQSLNIENL